MNAVEICDAVSDLAATPFDAIEFPFAFLAAFGTRDTTIKRLRAGNSSDIFGGVLLRDKIHIATCGPGQVSHTFAALKASRKTASGKAKFLLTTDGTHIEAENLVSGEPLSCAYGDLPEHFGFFLALAGISTIREIEHSAIDIKATSHLNKLYLELCKYNPDWTSGAQFMARLIFCFFAEDTGIIPEGLFTTTIREMTEPDGGNTQTVISELFRAMDIALENRRSAKLRPWADKFPYVNGGLYTDPVDYPKFSRTARSYLLRVGDLNWKDINPDIFGSMIQAIADPDERGSLGMHYTSVPNILKVLNPLFLDDLRFQLESAGNNQRKLKNLRRRIASIRVFDPACGSGNFLVIAYREMRAIEAMIIERLGGDDSETHVRLENFYGIEVKPFPVEIAKLALLIAEFQADVRFRGERLACLNVLPLHRTGQIHVGNALRMNWLEICPPEAQENYEEWDLGGPTGRMALESDGLAERRGIETYICGNPPYKGSQTQSSDQKQDLATIAMGLAKAWRLLDYVAGWFIKSALYIKFTNAQAAFVSTNSICQGRIVPVLWPIIASNGSEIIFAHTSFKWSNLAAKNAGVTVVIVGISREGNNRKKLIFEENDDGGYNSRVASSINAYLVSGANVIVEKRTKSICGLPRMDFGNMPIDGGGLLMNREALSRLGLTREQRARFIKKAYGSAELIRGIERYCLWLGDEDLEDAMKIGPIRERVEAVKKFRSESKDDGTRALAESPHRLREMKVAKNLAIAVPSVSSESRGFLPATIINTDTIVTNLAFAINDAHLWNMSLIISRLHLVWIATVCGKLKTDYRYSNTLGWNTFPVPTLTEKNKHDLTRCAEEILLARENHFPKTIADLYQPENIPEDLRRAHEHNDETLERIYIGRRFRNDTERLEKLFDLYIKMTSTHDGAAAKAKVPRKAKATS